MNSLQRFWLCVGAMVFASSCAGARLEERSRQVRSLIAEARASGAYKCAPRQLAFAESHVVFADSELHQGDYFRAKDHLDFAEAQVSEALRESPADRCLATAKQPTVKVALEAKPKDADGDGVLDEDDKCPKEAEDKDGFEDADGCPDPDNDADGVMDVADKCALEAEDKDNFEDADGCPELDNDGDKIADAQDQCPMEREDFDSFEDADGCPERDNDKDSLDDLADKCPNQAGPPGTGGCPEVFKHIEVTKDKIELKQKIFFASAKALIQSRSFELLEEVASALKSRPTMRLRIEGHTDSQGKRASNLRLSQLRADAVKAHLMGLGVAADRMESVGFGPDQPIETNRTASGRDRNRRVEFVITAQ
ncbi:MAG: OmpA family protein [Deltaproteobacteria bacterium]|nr:OmpA family protein [Deltaproteobacteria bacterium]